MNSLLLSYYEYPIFFFSLILILSIEEGDSVTDSIPNIDSITPHSNKPSSLSSNSHILVGQLRST